MDQIAQIKQNLDVVTIVGSYVSLKKSGKNYKGLCPFHGEKTPSFMVSPELQIYKCFGCGKSGDIFSFVQDIEGVDFHTALEDLAAKAGVKLEKTVIDKDADLKKHLFTLNESAARFYNYILTQHVGGKLGLDYFKVTRGLSDTTIKAFLLGYAPNQGDLLYKYFSKNNIDPELMLKAGLVIKKDDGSFMDKFRGRVMFPFVGVDGKISGFTGRTIFDREPKYLNTAETPVFQKSFFIYGLNAAKVAVKKKGALFVEGQMDVISAHEAGFDNVVGVSGTSLTQGQLKLLSRYTQDITFCFDTDTAGVFAAFRGIELAENLGFNIKVAQIPEPYKDIDEFIRKSKAEATEMLTTAVPAYDYLLYTVIKRQDKNSPEGKKKIMDELIPWFARIKNKVLIDHYSKEIARELGLNIETVTQALNAGDIAAYTEDFVTTSNTMASQQSIESYIITLLFKGDLDFITTMAYKVEPEDFADGELVSLLQQLQDYLSGIASSSKKTQKAKEHQKFDPKDFQKKLTTEQATVFEGLYLKEVDIGHELDGDHLQREFESALFRLKNQKNRKKMAMLSEEIKLAEKSNDVSAVKKLTAEFEKLTQQLVEQ